MNHLFLGLLGFAVVGVILTALTIWLVTAIRSQGKQPQGGEGPKTPWNKIKENAFARGFGIAIFLTVVYVFLLWLGYNLTAGALVRQLGTEKRWAFLLITVLGLPLIEVIWWLYKAAGVPGESKVIGRSFRTFAVFVLIFLGWWYHDQPNRLFEPESGKASFWVAEKEKKLYFFPSSSKPKVYFSPATGETLRLGTPADAERFRKDSWLPKAVRDAKNLLHGSGISSVAEAAAGKTILERIAPVGEFSEYIRTPLDRYAVVLPDGRIRIRTLCGTEFDDAPGEGGHHFGTDPCNHSFAIMSLEDEPVKVTIAF